MLTTNNGYSLSDFAAIQGRDGFGAGNGAWWLIVLFLFCFMGGWNGNGKNYATAEDMQNQFNFASLERQNNEIMANSRQMAYDLTGAIKDSAYALNTTIRDADADLKENVRDIQALVQGLGAEVQNCCCATNRNIDSVRYDAALNTRDILKNSCDNTQKILDAISGNRIADMQNQINQLQLQAALNGVVRYPLATTYTAGYAPTLSFPSCGAGCGIS